MNSKNLIWGMVGTVAWLLIIFLFSILKGYELPSSLNELGDALAGIVAPIAFFWLILGYVQQGKQLEQNSIAINQQAKALQQQAEILKLQIDEMKESVKQQKVLTNIHNDQLVNTRNSILPKFEIQKFTILNQKKIGDGFLFNVSWVNLGNTVYDVEIYILLIDKLMLAVPRWVTDQIIESENFSKYDMDDLMEHEESSRVFFPIMISYKDKQRNQCEDFYNLNLFFDNQNKLDLVTLVQELT